MSSIGGASGTVARQPAELDIGQTAPGLIAASGTALLPGDRVAEADPLLGPGPAAGLAAVPGVNPPLATGPLTSEARGLGPLLGLDGERTSLLGIPSSQAMFVAPAASTVVPAGSAVSTATTQILASASGAATKAVSAVPGIGGSGTTTVTVTPPLIAPTPSVAASVPGTTSLATIVKLLRGGLVGH